jgi:hypothetical protein
VFDLDFERPQLRGSSVVQTQDLPDILPNVMKRPRLPATAEALVGSRTNSGQAGQSGLIFQFGQDSSRLDAPSCDERIEYIETVDRLGHNLAILWARHDEF